MAGVMKQLHEAARKDRAAVRQAKRQARATRKVQPKCGNCNHSRSFHDGGTKRCLAMGCGCKRWKGAKSQRAALGELRREDLRNLAKTRGLPSHGRTKEELIDAIVAHDKELASA